MRDITQLANIAASKWRAVLYSALGPVKFDGVGHSFKFYGIQSIAGAEISLGANCWFEAVETYKGRRFSPALNLGHRTKFSNNVHLSSVLSINIGSDCLFGSNIYIGDHSHGTTDAERINLSVAPALRELDDVAAIEIGDRVWIGDGVVILAGTSIPSGSVVGANSVVRGKFPTPGLIAGAPARLLKEFR